MVKRIFKSAWLISLVVSQAVIANTTSQTSASLSQAQRILEYIDQGRAAKSPFQVKLKIIKQTDQTSFSYRLVDDGKSRSVLYFLDKHQRGQKVLATEDETWFFSNRTRRAIKIPAVQTLFGDASIGDIARIRFSADYAPTSLEQDAELTTLSLSSKHPAATYQAVVLTLNRANNLPQQAKFFAASGKHLKTADFTEVSIEQGIPVIHEWKLYSPDNMHSATIVQSSDFEEVSVPAVAFTKPYLELTSK